MDTGKTQGIINIYWSVVRELLEASTRALSRKRSGELHIFIFWSLMAITRGSNPERIQKHMMSLLLMNKLQQAEEAVDKQGITRREFAIL